MTVGNGFVLDPQLASEGTPSTSKPTQHSAAQPKAHLSNAFMDAILMPGSGKKGKQRAKAKAKGTAKKAAHTQVSEKITKPSTKILESFDDADFLSSDESADERTGGIKLHHLMPKVSRPCRPKDAVNGKQKKRARCLASAGCHRSWSWPRSLSRVLAHAQHCSWLPSELRREAAIVLANRGGKELPHLADESILLSEGPSESSSRQDDTQSELVSVASQSDDDDRSQRSLVSWPAPKKLKTGATSTAASASVFSPFVKQGRKELKQRADHAVLNMIVCNGIPLRVLDSVEWKELVAVLSPQYQPPCSSTLRDQLLPMAAAYIQQDITKFLQRTRNLTLSFDGGKIRKPKGIISISVTTPDRRTFLMDLNDASGVSHTARYYMEIIEPVVESIGEWNFAGFVSDNTGNTNLARRLAHERWMWVLNMQDCVHEMALAVMQISGLDEFSETITDMKGLLAFVSRSTYTAEQLDHARQRLNIRRGLERVGETRFSTLVWSALSVRACLPAFREIAGDRRLGVEFGGHGHLVEPNSASTMQFELGLTKFIAVTVPFARAIKCLESSHSTAADVYLFWLAVTSQLYSLLHGNRVGLSARTIEDIRAITNKRFKEMIEDAPEDIYLTSFFLDPRYRKADIYHNPNPLVIRVPPAALRHGTTPTSAEPVNAQEKMIRRVGLALQRILKAEYGDALLKEDVCEIMKTRNPMLAKYTPREALESLKEELKGYARGYQPFDQPLRERDTVREWWIKVQHDASARILGMLAEKLYSVVPNSICEERIMSQVSWLNAPRRSRQDVATLKEHIIVRQWKRSNPKSKPAVRSAPTVKWRDMERTILGKRSSEETDDEDSIQDGLVENDPAEQTEPAQVVSDWVEERRDTFEVAGDAIDLTSPVLLDILAEHGSIPVKTVGQNASSGRGKKKDVANESQGLDWDAW